VLAQGTAIEARLTEALARTTELRAEAEALAPAFLAGGGQ
jgi:hypothetical protein